MWSETKPIGTRTTLGAPSPCTRSRWSLTSGSSHGTCGAAGGTGAGAEHQGVRVPGPRPLPPPLDDLVRDAAVLLDVRAAVRPAGVAHRLRQRVGDARQVGGLAGVGGE